MVSPDGSAGWCLIIGLAAVLVVMAWKWRQDTEFVKRLNQSPASQFPKSRAPWTPKVSVLLPAWREREMISSCIESFLALDYPNKELIVCAGGDDGTFEVAAGYASENVIVLEQQAGEGKQGALRRCLDRASGEIIFLTDADCLLDDDSFIRTLTPLILEGENVATGISRPLQRQLDNPFVIYQWCTDNFVAARRPKFITGVLGRNCAVRRRVLEKLGGFKAEIHTGTDYHMAKLLLHHGYRIRYVRESAIQTKYPETFHSYWRCQSRWLRNLILHGWALKSYREMATSLKTSLLGLTMLMLPFVAIVVGPILLAIWGTLLVYAFLARVRYAHFARLYQGIDIPLSQYMLIPVYTFVDFIAWSLPLIDLLIRRHEW